MTESDGESDATRVKIPETSSTATKLDFLQHQLPSKLNERAVQSGSKTNAEKNLNLEAFRQINISVGKRNLLVDFTKMTRPGGGVEDKNIQIITLGHDILDTHQGKVYCYANFMYALKKNWMQNLIMDGSVLLIHTDRIDFSKEVQLPTNGDMPTLVSQAGRHLSHGKHYCQAMIVRKNTPHDLGFYDIVVPHLSPEFRVICLEPISVLKDDVYRPPALRLFQGTYLQKQPVFAFVSIVSRASTVSQTVDDIIKKEIKESKRMVVMQSESEQYGLRDEDLDVAELTQGTTVEDVEEDLRVSCVCE